MPATNENKTIPDTSQAKPASPNVMGGTARSSPKEMKAFFQKLGGEAPLNWPIGTKKWLIFVPSCLGTLVFATIGLINLIYKTSVHSLPPAPVNASDRLWISGFFILLTLDIIRPRQRPTFFTFFWLGCLLFKFSMASSLEGRYLLEAYGFFSCAIGCLLLAVEQLKHSQAA